MTNEREKGREKRPPKPRRTLPGIAAVYRHGRWRWRACITVRERLPSGEPRDRQRVGPLRDTQRAAFDDVDGLRAEAARGGRQRWTLLEALNATIDRKLAEGLPEYTVTRCWRSPSARILERFRGAALLESITVEMVQAWALQLLDGGLASSTVRKGRLAVLHQAFLAAGLASPVPEVIRALGKRLRPVHRRVHGYDVATAAEILRRAHAWRPPTRHTTPEALAIDLLVIDLAATTGIRHDELARLRRRDIDLDRGVIHVASKVRSLPRDEPIVPELRASLEARLRELADDDSPLLPGYGTPKPRQVAWEAQNRWLNRHRARWKKRLGDPRFSLRVLRRTHGSGLDELGASFAMIRDALGHTRTSGETQRYLLAGDRAVTEAKRRLATHLLPPSAGGQGSAAEPPAEREPGPGGEPQR